MTKRSILAALAFGLASATLSTAARADAGDISLEALLKDGGQDTRQVASRQSAMSQPRVQAQQSAVGRKADDGRTTYAVKSMLNGVHHGA